MDSLQILDKTRTKMIYFIINIRFLGCKDEKKPAYGRVNELFFRESA